MNQEPYRLVPRFTLAATCSVCMSAVTATCSQGKVGGIVRYSYSPPGGVAGLSMIMMAQVEATFDWVECAL